MNIRIKGREQDGSVSLARAQALVESTLTEKQSKWVENLREDPSQFPTIEREVQQTCLQMADYLTAGLLAEASAAGPMGWLRKKLTLRRKAAVGGKLEPVS